MAYWTIINKKCQLWNSLFLFCYHENNSHRSWMRTNGLGIIIFFFGKSICIFIKPYGYGIHLYSTTNVWNIEGFAVNCISFIFGWIYWWVRPFIFIKKRANFTFENSKKKREYSMLFAMIQCWYKSLWNNPFLACAVINKTVLQKYRSLAHTMSREKFMKIELCF